MRWMLWVVLPCLIPLAGCKQAREIVSRFEKKQESPSHAAPGPAPAPATSSPASAHDLSAAEFPDFIAAKDKLVVVDFHAEWCPPCRQLGPLLEKLVAEHDDHITLGKINVDHAKDLAAKLGIRSIPDVRFFRNGKEIDRFVGLPPEPQLRAKLEKHLATATQEQPAAETLQPPAPKSPAQSDKPTVEPKPQPKEPTIQPMRKDWMPPGIQRR